MKWPARPPSTLHMVRISGSCKAIPQPRRALPATATTASYWPTSPPLFNCREACAAPLVRLRSAPPLSPPFGAPTEPRHARAAVKAPPTAPSGCRPCPSAAAMETYPRPRPEVDSLIGRKRCRSGRNSGLRRVIWVQEERGSVPSATEPECDWLALERLILPLAKVSAYHR